jgi:hypothetical protein
MLTKQALKIEPYDGTLGDYWKVSFIGDFAVITMTVESLNEDDATTLACDLFMDYYGMDLTWWHSEVEEVE